MAESEGFEPPIRCRIPDFESGAFDHSANSPRTGDYTDFPQGPCRTDGNHADACQTNGGETPPHCDARATRAMTTNYFVAGAAAGAAGFMAGAGGAPVAGAAAATAVGATCGVTTLPFAFCSAI